MKSIIIAHLLYSGSAATNRILAYAKGFVEAGKDVHLILGCDKNAIEPNVNIKNVDVVVIRSTHALVWFLMARSIKKIYKKNDSAILVYGSPLICLWLPKSNYNIFYECTEIPFFGRKKTLKRRIREGMKSLLVRRATGVMVISKALATYFHNRGMKNIAVINMFVDSSRFDHAEVRHNGKYIAYCGWVSETKDGVDILIKAYDKFRKGHEDYKLYIIGDFMSKNDETNLSSLVSSLGHMDNVVFTGKVTPSEMPSLLCNAQILALARPDNEQAEYGFPTKLGEYLATGKPVVVTCVGEIDDFLYDGVNCRMAEPGNAEEFAECLAWVADNYEEAKMLGKAGRMLTQKEFSNIEQSKKALAFMQEVIRK